MRPLLSYTLLAAGAAGALSSVVPAAPLSPQPAVSIEAPARAPVQGQRGVHAFYFTRAQYNDYRGGGRGNRGGGSWATDWPKSDNQFVTVLKRLTNLDVQQSEFGNVVRLDDPELRRFPFIYMLEVGGISLSQAEVEGLRGYLLAGGFAFIDDFWGDGAFYNFASQMKVVLPKHEIVELRLDHPIFKTFYEIEALQQMPSINHWRSGDSTECFGCVYRVFGIFDEDERLLMMIHWNTDNGDAWEWAEQPDIPLRFTTYAYQIGVNAIVYSMSH
jgi:hypothetical protein